MRGPTRGWEGQPERGSASMLVLVMVGVLAFVCLALLLCSSLVVSHRRTQAAADLAALAGASAATDVQGDARGGAAQGACAAAAEVAVANGGRVAACTTDLAGHVSVEVALTDPATGLELSARARAGPA